MHSVVAVDFASLPIASGVTSIGVGVFQFCSGLTVKNVFFSASDQALEVLHIASNSSTWVQYKQVHSSST
jgi:hypothetical protein